MTPRAPGANGQDITRTKWEAMTDTERGAWSCGPGRGRDGQSGSVTLVFLGDGTVRVDAIGGGPGGTGGRIVDE